MYSYTNSVLQMYILFVKRIYFTRILFINSLRIADIFNPYIY